MAEEKTWLRVRDVQVLFHEDLPADVGQCVFAALSGLGEFFALQGGMRREVFGTNDAEVVDEQIVDRRCDESQRLSSPVRTSGRFECAAPIRLRTMRTEQL